MQLSILFALSAPPMQCCENLRFGAILMHRSLTHCATVHIWPLHHTLHIQICVLGSVSISHSSCQAEVLHTCSSRLVAWFERIQLTVFLLSPNLVTMLMSFLWIMNRTSTRTEPWGLPLVSGTHLSQRLASDVCPSTLCISAAALCSHPESLEVMGVLILNPFMFTCTHTHVCYFCLDRCLQYGSPIIVSRRQH